MQFTIKLEVIVQGEEVVAPGKLSCYQGSAVEQMYETNEKNAKVINAVYGVLKKKLNLILMR